MLYSNFGFRLESAILAEVYNSCVEENTNCDDALFVGGGVTPDAAGVAGVKGFQTV